MFRYLNSALPQLYCLKFLFKLANISRSYEENKIFRSRCFIAFHRKMLYI